MLHAALAFGKPLVLSRIGGFIDVSSKHGAARLVQPGDVAELAAALRDLLGDPAKRRRLGAAAATAADRTHGTTSPQRTLRLYQDLLRDDAQPSSPQRPA